MVRTKKRGCENREGDEGEDAGVWVEAKRLKHLGDLEPDLGLRCVLYLKAAMMFTVNIRRIKQISQTLNLLRHTLNLLTSKKMMIKDVRLEVLCLRAQALLQVELQRLQTLKDTGPESNNAYYEEDDQPPEAKRLKVDTGIKTEPGVETEDEQYEEKRRTDDVVGSENSNLTKHCLAFCSQLASQGRSFKMSLDIGSHFSFSLDTSEQTVTEKAEVAKDGENKGNKVTDGDNKGITEEGGDNKGNKVADGNIKGITIEDGDNKGNKVENNQAGSSSLSSESLRLWQLASSLLAGTGGQEAGQFFQQLEVEVGALGLEAGLEGLLTYTNRALEIISPQQ